MFEIDKRVRIWLKLKYSSNSSSSGRIDLKSQIWMLGINLNKCRYAKLRKVRLRINNLRKWEFDWGLKSSY